MVPAIPDDVILGPPETGPARPDLLSVLSTLRQIGAAINRFGPRGSESTTALLGLVANGPRCVLPEATVVLYAYDPEQRAFLPQSRSAAGERSAEAFQDIPRPHGFGMRAIQQRRPLLSYQQVDLSLHPAHVRAGARSLACFPLWVADQPVGALYVYLPEGRPFTDLELLLLETFAHQAASALFQTRRWLDVQQDLARKEDELNRLRRTGLLISSRLGLQETLETILQMALEVTGAHYGIFRLVDPQGATLVTRAVAGSHSGHPHVEAFPIDSNTIMGWVARHRQPLCIHDLHAAPWNRIYHPLYADLQMHSELAVPLVGSSGRLEGVLNLESPRIGAFSEEDSLLLQAMATQAVIAIQEARLLDTLLAVAQDLLLRSAQAVLDRLVELACDLLNAAAATLWLLDADALALRAASGDYEHSARLPLQGSLMGQALETGKTVVSEDLRSDPRFHRPDLAARQNWSRALVVPVLSSDKHEPIGAFGVYGLAADPSHFTESEWDEKVLTCLAYYAALALHTEERQEALRAAQERQAIAETFAAVGDIAANVLHHLNNKVGTIPVRIQGIQDKCSSVLDAEPYLASNLTEIERSAREAMTAVRESLYHLRPIQAEPLRLASSMLDAIEAAAPPPGVTIHTVELESLPPVMAAQHSLVLLFTNLIENAIHAMAGQGSITIEGRALEAWVEVSVADTGPGIPLELHERIFDFDHAGRRPQRNGKLGFGLWWVKTLLVRLGGAIAVESDGQHGTVFRIRLPRAVERT